MDAEVKLKELEARVALLTASVTAEEKLKESAIKELEDVKLLEVRRELDGKLVKVISESALPDIAKTKLTGIVATFADETAVKEAVTTETAYLAALKESRVTGLGSTSEETDDSDEAQKKRKGALVAGFRALGLSATLAESAALGT